MTHYHLAECQMKTCNETEIHGHNDGGWPLRPRPRMKRGRTERETLDLNGWGVGTLVRGHEQWSDGRGVWSTWRITGLGDSTVLARTVLREYTQDGALTGEVDEKTDHETTVTFDHREWAEVPKKEPIEEKS